MSCDHQLLAEHVCDYCEGSLPPSLREACAAALEHCEHCRAIHAQALEFQQFAKRWRTCEVPPWHRSRFAVKPPARGNRWLSWSALAFSCLALVMVVLRVEVSSGDGLLISMGGRQAEAQVMARLAAELEAYRSESEQALETRLAAFAESQGSANRLLLADWLERNRGERRQDLDFLMSAWQSQRLQDQRQLGEHLDYLAYSQIENNDYLNELLKTVQFPPPR